MISDRNDALLYGPNEVIVVVVVYRQAASKNAVVMDLRPRGETLDA